MCSKDLNPTFKKKSREETPARASQNRKRGCKAKTRGRKAKTPTFTIRIITAKSPGFRIQALSSWKKTES
jgi:hypothetical protein